MHYCEARAKNISPGKVRAFSSVYKRRACWWTRVGAWFGEISIYLSGHARLRISQEKKKLCAKLKESNLLCQWSSSVRISSGSLLERRLSSHDMITVWRFRKVNHFPWRCSDTAFSCSGIAQFNFNICNPQSFCLCFRWNTCKKAFVIYRVNAFC